MQAPKIGACVISFRLPGKEEQLVREGDQVLRKEDLRKEGAYYHDNTKTNDVWRYKDTHHLPLTTKFTDNKNVEWKVKIVDKTGNCNMCVPKSSGMDFYAEHGHKERVGMDATAHFMCFEFRYEKGNDAWYCVGPTCKHGIHIHTEGYTDPDYANSDWDNWIKALEMVEKGAKVASSVTAVGVQIAGAVATGGAAGR